VAGKLPEDGIQEEAGIGGRATGREFWIFDFRLKIGLRG
jgi:hypothetical protein